MAHPDIDDQPPQSLLRAVEPLLGPSVQGAWQPLTGGRTNRLWRVGAHVVKFYQTSAGNPLFPNDPQGELTAVMQAAPLGLAPTGARLISGPFGDAMIYDFVAGETGFPPPSDLARQLARLHRSTVPKGLRRLATGSEALIGSINSVISEIPASKETWCRALDRLTVLAPVPPTSLAFIHGDPVASNIVNTVSGPVLIDWQCPAMGDPCDDLALVLSPSMALAYSGWPRPEAGQRFLEAYPDPKTVARYRRLAPYYHLRQACYAAWSDQQGRSLGREAVALELDAFERSLSPATE